MTEEDSRQIVDNQIRAAGGKHKYIGPLWNGDMDLNPCAGCGLRYDHVVHDYEVLPPDARRLSDDEPEALIELECARFMAEDGWRGLKTNPVSRKSRGAGFGEPGMADFEFIRPALPGFPGAAHRSQEAWCQLLWIEFKAGKKGAQKHQLEWHAKERALGFVTLIANEDFPATIDGFKNWYEKSGYMRRDKWW
jgi:hypothetical protein